MPKSSVEWTLLYIGTAYTLAGSIMVVAVVAALLRQWGQQSPTKKIISDLLTLLHFGIYGMSLIFVLPFILDVAQSGGQDNSTNRYFLYLTGFITLGCVLCVLYFLKKRINLADPID